MIPIEDLVWGAVWPLSLVGAILCVEASIRAGPVSRLELSATNSVWGRSPDTERSGEYDRLSPGLVFLAALVVLLVVFSAIASLLVGSP